MLLFIEQSQRASCADAETLEVGELGILRVGVVETYEQHGNDAAGRISHRCVLRHVEAVEKQCAPHIVLPTEQTFIRRVRMIERSTNGAAAVLFGQGGRNANELVAIAHEYRGHAGRERSEFIHLVELVVEAHISKVKRRRLQCADGNALIGMHIQAAAKALLE